MDKKGFTLIELLVVIAIIGLLSTLAVVALSSARLKSRDAKRVSDLKQMQTALELYFTDQNAYPSQNGTLGAGNWACLNSAGWQATNCANPYMARVPGDPGTGSYVYSVGTSTYTITTALEGTVNGLSSTIKLTPAGIGQ